MSQANRGKWFESAIEATAKVYLQRTTAHIVKIPTPYRMVPDGQSKKLIRIRSTVDFFGTVNGIPVAFDAKTIKKGHSIPMRNVHPHQLDSMEAHARCGGLGFLLINLEEHGTWACTNVWWSAMCQQLDRKSVPVEAFEFAATNPRAECFEVVHGGHGVAIDFAPAVSKLYALVHGA